MVCRLKKAGVCKISATSATWSKGVSSCTSVMTAKSKSVLTFCKMRKPSSIPNPLKLLRDDRLALSKEALKTNGMFKRIVISLSASAVVIINDSDSITQGPANKNKGLSNPA